MVSIVIVPLATKINRGIESSIHIPNPAAKKVKNPDEKLKSNPSMTDISEFPVNKNKCVSCPFRDDADIESQIIRRRVEQRILEQDASQICHSTDNSLCRGARDFIQVIMFYRG